MNTKAEDAARRIVDIEDRLRLIANRGLSIGDNYRLLADANWLTDYRLTLLATQAAREAKIVEVAEDVIADKRSTFKARNGRDVGIEDDSGEMCWIVGHEPIGALERAIRALKDEQQP